MMHLGLGGQRPRDGDALALAAGQLARVAVGDPAGRRTESSSRLDLAAGLAPTHPSQQPGPAGRCVADGAARVERPRRVLEDDLDPPALLDGAPPGQAQHLARRAAITPAAGVGCSPAMQRAIVVLPLPDSPTRATHSPGAHRSRAHVGCRDHRPPPATRCSARSASTRAPVRRPLSPALRRRCIGSASIGAVSAASEAADVVAGLDRIQRAAPRRTLLDGQCRSGARRRSRLARSPTPTAMPRHRVERARSRVIGDGRAAGPACTGAVAGRAPPARAPPRPPARRTSRRSGRRSGPTTARSCVT